LSWPLVQFFFRPSQSASFISPPWYGFSQIFVPPLVYFLSFDSLPSFFRRSRRSRVPLPAVAASGCLVRSNAATVPILAPPGAFLTAPVSSLPCTSLWVPVPLFFPAASTCLGLCSISFFMCCALVRQVFFFYPWPSLALEEFSPSSSVLRVVFCAVTPPCLRLLLMSFLSRPPLR